MIDDIIKVEMLTDGPVGVGTRWRETRMMFKKEATEEMWVTGFDPPNGYTVEAESHGMHYSTLFSFTPDRDGTKVSWVFSGTALSLGAKIMSPIFSVFMTGMMKKCMLRDLEALRGVVKFPVRIKCATLSWNTLLQALDELRHDGEHRAHHHHPGQE